MSTELPLRTAPTASRQIHLAAYPRGRVPEPADFELAEVVVPELGEGEVLVRNTWMSVDPYMRGRMNGVRTYADPYVVGEALSGGAVGEVVGSRSPRFAPGDVVRSNLGWREYAWGNASAFQPVDTALAPAQAFLGVLGMPGLTAYVGLLDIAGAREGDTVFVSAASGAVGSIAGQLARLRGCRVIGSAGSPAKVRLLTDELGFDAAFDYRSGDIEAALARAAPDGLDVYFDNVGGDQLRAAIGAMRPFGRIAVCGMISTYNDASLPPGPNNLMNLVARRLTMRGFLVFDHWDREPAFVEEVSGYLREGRLAARETVVDSLEAAPGALIGLLRGENVGKMLVRLAT